MNNNTNGKNGTLDFSAQFLREVCETASQIDTSAADRVVRTLAETRTNGGRLFILGVGGSAANASHAVNDFRKIAGIEAYAPTDNVSELTARTNDEGWPGVFESWLRTSRLRKPGGIPSSVLALASRQTACPDNRFFSAHASCAVISPSETARWIISQAIT